MAGKFIGAISANNIKRTIKFDYNGYLFPIANSQISLSLPNIRHQNSIVFLEPYYIGGVTRPDYSMVGGVLDSPTSLTLHRYNSGSGGFEAAGGATIIEFNNVKYKKTGILTRNGNSSTVISFDKQVNTDKLIISASMTSRYSSTGWEADMSIGTNNITPFSLSFQHDTQIDRVFYEIIELY